jgi:hypothetical protein
MVLGEHLYSAAKTKLTYYPRLVVSKSRRRFGDVRMI